MTKYYDWDSTFSRQTGSQGEFVIVTGGKDIGKTFGLRLKCTEEAIKKNIRFVELCRSKDEAKAVSQGYFDKLQQDGFFHDYQFKSENLIGYYAPAKQDKPEWEPIVYFVSLTMFQREKKRTFAKVKRVIFDEALIDTKDKHHRYLNQEVYILANLLDSIFRENPDAEPYYKVYLIGNSCDLTCPYLHFFGIDRIPDYGYHWYNNKSVLFHYVEPWDSEKRKVSTFVGRMLAGDKESEMIFDNRFDDGGTKDIQKKTSAAKFAYALVYDRRTFAIWIDYNAGLFFVNSKVPNDAKNVYSLTKKDKKINYQAVNRQSQNMQMLLNIYYKGGLRYDTPSTREAFLTVLGFLGIK